MTTTHINTVDAKESFSELINRVSHHKERIILTRRGNAVAALIPMEDFDHLEAMKEKLDLDEAIISLKEGREHGFITLADLKRTTG